eukprot:TRINITY_DN7126_c0_g1_i1.p2 TRINITY_DN7126_c0_g1~~TRINITY_DN7126_c0_g1_i1.p2  ORF type:complete len:168 (-),score=23.90 TRINITY_DN7126_c0_g1_i1:79-582(-)
MSTSGPTPGRRHLARIRRCRWKMHHGAGPITVLTLVTRSQQAPSFEHSSSDLPDHACRGCARLQQQVEELVKEREQHRSRAEQSLRVCTQLQQSKELDRHRPSDTTHLVGHLQDQVAHALRALLHTLQLVLRLAELLSSIKTIAEPTREYIEHYLSLIHISEPTRPY